MSYVESFRIESSVFNNFLKSWNLKRKLRTYVRMIVRRNVSMRAYVVSRYFAESASRFRQYNFHKLLSASADAYLCVTYTSSFLLSRQKDERIANKTLDVREPIVQSIHDDSCATAIDKIICLAIVCYSRVP